MGMREEFEAWVSGRKVVTRHGAKLNQTSVGNYSDYRINDRWLAWQACHRLNVPAWNPMSIEPPFPFRGDIFSDGKLITGADWAAGYWQSPKGERSVEQVSHWKYPNAAIEPPSCVTIVTTTVSGSN